ncbi:cupin-like domain-containing protein [Stakelama saccharophila]|uniref:Cupin-like domain-containing protein n=1 Tax=Stakelama saccharophila TaxID=3075605 RepID=A0ABZ0BA95_9SPHN|nr:cupin-like domain-containing protein [Stakelama sp. W311]WNO54031.1 cupin-like domain-containing protein [Stakelama sp. W311]
MASDRPPVAEITGLAPGDVRFEDLLAEQRPVILKGLVRDWPLVAAGARSPGAAMAELLRFYQGKHVTGFTGRPDIDGRFFYNQDATALDFAGGRVALDAFLDRIREHLDDPQPPAFYVGSTDIDTYLPGFRAENDLPLDEPMFAAHPPIASIWIGNRTVAATHYDMSNNIACCLVGRRRFTLFPPDQVANLYPGPLEPTPGGQVLSMADPRAPDFDRYPRFRDALAAAQTAELDPGDALIYPALWWHQVEALDRFNIMVNYWWNIAPRYMDTPMNTLLHAFLSLRGRTDAEKRAWRTMFDYYVFGPAEQARAHLPEAAHGDLAPLDEAQARRLRAKVMQRLNR